MQIKETIGVPFPGPAESLPLEDVVVLADSAGVSLGVRRAFSARVRRMHDGSSGGIASRCAEIPLVGRDGEISGVLCQTAPQARRAPLRRAGGVRAIGDVAQFVVHDVNNLLAVIDFGLRLLERQSDAACRKTIGSRMRHAITRGSSLSRQFLDAARPCSESIGGFVVIVIADDGEGMPEEVLSQALPQFRRFAEGGGSAVSLESERGAGTLVRLFLPRVGDAAVQSSIVSTEIVCTPSPNGGAFHVVNPDAIMLANSFDVHAPARNSASNNSS
ncbi:hybrid sensor histidine kinase/response regulator [Bradyrhizobium sp. Cp5.3]|uniref:hybrid sensor histidine kinase/response regulator n=1 Tax=Bradyrhizobium sp. Cp5.3 TaxID=443598 RepID=UPI000684C6E7|nr:hybrid sensor histidine kinase/response regulator [Bradyrhizobium sp. Cp5.3]